VSRADKHVVKWGGVNPLRSWLETKIWNTRLTDVEYVTVVPLLKNNLRNTFSQTCLLQEGSLDTTQTRQTAAHSVNVNLKVYYFNRDKHMT
jgi:phosphoribosylamine-glycine ligase